MCTALRSTETWELCVLKLVLPEDLCHLTISTGWRLRGSSLLAGPPVFLNYTITTHHRQGALLKPSCKRGVNEHQSQQDHSLDQATRQSYFS